MRELRIPDTFNVATAFIDENLVQGRGRKIALYYEDKTYTYQEVFDRVNKAGNALKELGVEMEQRVLMIMLDSPEFVATFWGAIKIGAVPVPVNTLMRAADYEYFLNNSRAKVLVVHEALLPEIEKIQKRLKYLRHIVVVGKAKESQLSFYEMLDRASPNLEAAETHKDDVAFWLYSSGSTGLPKGAVHLQHDMMYCAEYYARGILGITEQDITFSAAKLFFAYGLGNNMYFPFRVGASAVLYPGRPTPDKMFEILKKYRPTLFYAVPTLYGAMLQVAEKDAQYEVPPSVRLCISAGEALPAEIYRRWKDRFGVEILDGIGSTEVLHIFLSNQPGKVKPGSSGTVVPGYEAKIVDEGDQEVPVGEIGNLLIKGDSTAAYYWNNQEKTRQTILGEWIRTGDKYYLDSEGYYWYCGRSDDMLKVGGMWVSPVEVESTLIEHPAVLESAVVGALDEENLIKPKAFVVLREGYHPSPELVEELQAFVKNKIAPYKYPRWIEFVKELPKTATGKIQRFKLRTLP
ncbi:MAG TPA: benzoate-CoA ligase family protein [Candidatus Limnocylindrales bacterium]|nr:benzoate-CoA ligase family protein [Candidatus Limnocylindrales bacterium]